MTDTEAKALALVNEVQLERGWKPYLTLSRHDCSRAEALCRAIERLEATEARHAAELREQAERFSKAAACYRQLLADNRWYADSVSYDSVFAPFILPAPDPLVEVWKEVWAVPHNSSDKLKAFRAAIEARGGKIVWEAGE